MQTTSSLNSILYGIISKKVKEYNVFSTAKYLLKYFKRILKEFFAEKNYLIRIFLSDSFKQRYQDSNLEMLESESSALPFGDSAINI